MIWVIATSTLLHIVDFAVDDGGVVESGNSGQWEYGVSSSMLSEGVNVWGTVLDGNYLSQSFDVLTVTVPDFNAADTPMLVLRHRYDIGTGDVARIEGFKEGTWQRVDPVYGYPSTDGFIGDSAGWKDTAFALDNWRDVSQFRFVFSSDSVGVADGWFLSTIQVFDGDIAPPQISNVAYPQDTQELQGTYDFRATIVDNISVDVVDIEWRVNGGEVSLSPMERATGSTYRGDIPAQSPDSVVSWRLRAQDGAQHAMYPEDGAWETFRVYLAAPTALRFDDERRVGQSVTLLWDAPESPHPIRAYQVRQAGDTTGVRCAAAPCVVPIDGDQDAEWSVAAWYDIAEGETLGDYSNTVHGTVFVPQITAITPDTVLPEERVWLRITGQYLLFGEGSTLDFGADITTETIRVLNSNTIDALVDVSSEISAEPQTLVIDGEVRAVFPDVLNVNTEDTAPRIVSVTPNRINQGFESRIVLCPSVPFFNVPQVTFGDGLVQTTPATLDAEGCVATSVAVKLSAPTGERPLLLDDAARIWTASLTVGETVVRPDRGCAVGASKPTALGCIWMIYLLVGGRRRPRQR